jgi:hypothetical protein
VAEEKVTRVSDALFQGWPSMTAAERRLLFTSVRPNFTADVSEWRHLGMPDARAARILTLLRKRRVPAEEEDEQQQQQQQQEEETDVPVLSLVPASTLLDQIAQSLPGLLYEHTLYIASRLPVEKTVPKQFPEQYVVVFGLF